MTTRRERRMREQHLRECLRDRGALEHGFRLAKDYWLPTGARWPGPSFLHPRETLRTVFKPVATTAGHSAYLALKESPLLLAVLFLAFLTSEAWQFFARLDLVEFLEVITGFLLLSLVAFVVGLRRPWVATYRILEPGHKGYDREVADSTRAIEGKLDCALKAASVSEATEPVAVPHLSRKVVGAVEVTRLFFLALVVGFAVAVFFIVLGAVAVDDGLTSAWTTRPGELPRHIPSDFELPLLGSVPGVTKELVQVSLALGGFAVLNFAVRVATDADTRSEAVDERFAIYGTAIRTWSRLYHGDLPREEQREVTAP